MKEKEKDEKTYFTVSKTYTNIFVVSIHLRKLAEYPKYI
jgi:hypothetical protein